MPAIPCVTWGSRSGAPYVPGIPIGTRRRRSLLAGRARPRPRRSQPYVDFSSLDVVGVVTGRGRRPALSAAGGPAMTAAPRRGLPSPLLVAAHRDAPGQRVRPLRRRRRGAGPGSARWSSAPRWSAVRRTPRWSASPPGWCSTSAPPGRPHRRALGARARARRATSPGCAEARRRPVGPLGTVARRRVAARSSARRSSR